MNKRLEWMSLIILVLLLTLACSLRLEVPTAEIRDRVVAIFDSEPEEELVRDAILVTPLATLTPTPTSTLTPTLISALPVEVLPGLPGPTETPAEGVTALDGSPPPGGATATPDRERPTPESETPAAVGPTPTTPPTVLASATLLPSPTLEPSPTALASPTLGASPTIELPTATLEPPPAAPTSDGGGDDDDPTATPVPPTVAFVSASYSVNEVDGVALITVSLNVPAKQGVTVNYTTGNGSAVAGRDYNPVSGSLTVNPGFTKATFSVPILNDLAVEPDQTIKLSLSGPTNAILGLNSAVLTIVNSCTLPDAIAAANTDTATGGCAAGNGDDIIDLEVTGAINLTAPLPNLSSNIEINGPGASNLTIRRDSGGDYRLFTIDNGQTVTISAVTIADGAVTGDNGGGILNNGGTVALTDCAISGNTTSGDGGGIANDGGSLTLINCIVTDNTANGGILRGGGGIWNNNGTLTLKNSIVSNNSAFEEGGGLFNNGTGTITIGDSAISNNTASRGGGMINRGDTITLDNTTVSDNIASAGFGGGIDNVFGATLMVDNSTISGNTAAGSGGGIDNFGVDSTTTVNNSVVSGNIAGFQGGGIFVDIGSTTTLLNTTITGNTANNEGGGLANVGNLTVTDSSITFNTGNNGGGGIYSFGGIADIANATISNNSAGSGSIGGVFGGGVKNANDSVLTLSNSTVSGNFTADDGAGLYNNDGANPANQMTLLNVTVSQNFAASEAGGIDNFGTFDFENSIIAGNTANTSNPDCRNLFGHPFTSFGFNLVGNGTGCPTVATDVTVNPADVSTLVLGPLQDNGGPTETHALLPGSPAIDVGTCAGAPPADQRGVARPQGADCDIGAYEFP